MQKTNWIQPPHNIKIKKHQADIWRVSLDVASASVQWASSTLSADENQRAARFHFHADRHRFTISHAALRDVLSRYLNQAPSQITFTIGQYGKPKVTSNTDLDFNLSHSGDYALIAVASGHKVGIDVEKHRHDMDHEKIAQRFFSVKENAEWNSLPREEKISGFFNCWTRKESYIKAHGLGLSMPLADFDVSISPNEHVTLSTHSHPHEAPQWTLRSLDVHPNYAGAVAAKGKKIDFRFWNWNSPTPDD